jgi:hypothetical protein
MLLVEVVLLLVVVLSLALPTVFAVLLVGRISMFMLALTISRWCCQQCYSLHAWCYWRALWVLMVQLLLQML